jgi:hypothetical protein
MAAFDCREELGVSCGLPLRREEVGDDIVMRLEQLYTSNSAIKLNWSDLVLLRDRENM